MDINNPQMQAMAAQMMADPEVMQMMQQPGMMEKIQGAMSNPASAMSDPDVMRIVMKLQGMGMGGGGGGGGMGGGGMGGGYSPPAASGAAPANIQHITTSAQLTSLLASAPKGSLIVIDYFTTWCGPCKAIAPLFSELATRYAGKVGFVKVDGDKSRDLVLAQGVSGFPTFEFYVDGQKIESFAGADQGKLQRIVEEYGEFTAPPAPCPYKHFPLRESESVKYADIKWDLVAPKFREFNSSKFALGDAAALSDAELKSLDSLLSTIQSKASYHSSSVSAAEFDVAIKMLTQWPKDGQGPVLNLLRMAVMHPEFAAKMAAPEAASAGKPGDLVGPLLKLALSADKSVLSLLSLRALVNCFSRRAVAKKVLAVRYEELLEGVAAAARKFSEDANVRLSVVAVYINYAILFAEDSASYEQAKVLLLTSVQELMQAAAADAKVAYRCAIVLGTLAYNDANVTELARDLDVLDAVAAAANSAAGKADPSMQQVAAELQQLIKPAAK